jgi:hypothetical protein
MKAKLRILVLTIICALIAVYSIQAALAQISLGTVVSVVPAQNNVQVGETLTVNITISNVENLYGLDITFNWNSSTLQLQSATSNLGVESHSNGVLHEASGSPIIVEEDNSSQEIGEYRLVATSQGTADSFNGSGVVATLTFNVTSLGHSELGLTSELADHPLIGETTSEFIAHNDVGGSVDAAAISEFPEVALLMLLAIFVTAALLFSRKFSAKTR